MRKNLLLFFLFCFATLGTALGQNITVKGTVLDENSDPVMGATVRLKSDATKGAITDMDGHFSLQAKTGEPLLITYVGYKDQEVKAAATLTIRLVPDNKLLDEVMVVGYGTSTKRSFTGSAVAVNAEALEKKSISSVSAALAGEVPGVNVVNTNGQPGSRADIYVRGVGSVNASTAPLYIVDGVPYDGDISSINPNDIESTTLLKDAASTAIYGSRGSNGVIVITTKSGKSGKMTITGDFKYGMNTSRFIPRHSVITDPDEYLEMAWSSLHMTGQYDDPAKIGKNGQPAYPDDPADYANAYIFGNKGISDKYNYYKEQDPSKIFDENGKVRPGLERRYTPEAWSDYAFQPSTRMESNLQIGGGTDKLKAFASFGYLDDKGIFKNSAFTRYSARTNVDFVPKDWIQLKGSLSYTHSLTNSAGQSDYSSTNIFTFIDNMPPIYPVFERDENGEMIPSPYYEGVNEYDYGEGRGYSGMSNGIATAELDPEGTKSNEISYNGSVIFRFLDGFSFENTFSGVYGNSRYTAMLNPFYGPEATSNGQITRDWQEIYSSYMLNLLRYNKSFKGGHSLEAFAAHEYQRYSFFEDYIHKNNLVDPFVDDLSNAIEQDVPAYGVQDNNILESYFLQANYDYLSRYFISGTFRYDGSSRFQKNKWGSFGSIGAAWVLSEEDFLKGNDILTFAKLKASYGSIGQQGGISYYSGQDIYEVEVVGGKPVLKFKDKGNPDLTWERSNMLQIGAELAFGKSLNLNIEFYDKRTSSLIYERRVAPSNGYALYNTNDGLLENYGADIDLTWKAIQGRDYYFTIRANAGFLGNKLLTLPTDPSTGEPKFIDESITPYGRMEGRSLYDYYIRNFEGVNPDNGLSEWTVYYIDKDGKEGFNPAAVSKGGDESIASLEQFKHDNPDKVDQIVKGKTTEYSKATRYHIGKSALPTVRGGFTLSGGYKGLEASVQFIYGIGGYGFDYVYQQLMNNDQIGSQNWSTDMRNRWMKPGDVTDVPRLNNGVDISVNGSSSRFLTSNSFLNMSNFMLSYTLPENWTRQSLGLNNVKLWISGDNLFLLSARQGFNPSTSLTGASSSYNYNPLSTITGGIRISF